MESIAIVGMGCRFPKANSPQAFWQLLRNGEDAITEVPKERWDINNFYHPDPTVPGTMSTRWGGFIDGVEGFDADFFGMSADEVEHTDPQQRLFLEVAWEALENAGIVPSRLSRSQTGVFIGLCTIDYHRLLYKDFAQLGPYSGTGTTPCIVANRLSYLLDLRGPSISIDAACASSLVTVHLACQSLRSGESDLCLAGGVNLILSPDSTIASSKTQLLSVAGRCKPFAADADGYVRGEGCGVVVLKRLSDAERDHDNILAVIRGSAVNQDGLSNSLTAPNGLAQQALIQQALRNANVRPADISYVDAHAVGTLIGDAIEIRALKTVLMKEREPDQPCLIGSTKPNVGHLEAASGMAALIKVILALQHQEIPPHLHLDQPNPYLGLESTPFEIPREVKGWSRGAKKRFAGISAFGFGGTNAHLVLEEAPVPAQEQHKTEPSHHLFTLSAKSEAALGELVQRYETLLDSSKNLSLSDLCFTTNTGRTHFNHRLCIVTRSIEQLRQQLRAWIAQDDVPGMIQGSVKGRKQPKVIFLFPNTGMTNFVQEYNLYETQPIFRQAFDRCVAILEPSLAALYPEISSSTLLKQVNHPAVLFAVEYSLAKLWLSWGITPKAVCGYGVGLYAAACIAGILSLEDALKLVLARSQRLETEKNDELVKVAQTVIYSQPRISFLSSPTEIDTAQPITSPEFWRQHLQQSEESSGEVTLPTQYDLCLKMELTEANPDTADMFHRLGELYAAGAAVQWSGLYYNHLYQRLQLPSYPFQRQRYWFRNAEQEPVTVAPREERSPVISIFDLNDCRKEAIS
jgi:acyl transferase domain-containing protein